MAVSDDPTTRLSWRIPISGDPRLLKLALAQVGLATLVAALILLVAGPREWLVPALLGLIPLAGLVAFWHWRRYQRSLVGADNVWIDARGLHWVDAGGQEQSITRDQVVAFRLARESDTLRDLPALTLLMNGGFESQPIELHPPATSSTVRQWLTHTWEIPERIPNTDDATYDFSADIYSECHDDFHEWHWEGTRAALAEFFELFQRAADELPAPPPGAKPAAWVVLARRRQPTRLRIAHASQPHFEPDLLAAPARILREISHQALLTMPPSSPGDSKFDVRQADDSIWTFHIHARNE